MSVATHGQILANTVGSISSQFPFQVSQVFHVNLPLWTPLNGAKLEHILKAETAKNYLQAALDFGQRITRTAPRLYLMEKKNSTAVTVHVHRGLVSIWSRQKFDDSIVICEIFFASCWFSPVDLIFKALRLPRWKKASEVRNARTFNPLSLHCRYSSSVVEGLQEPYGRSCLDHISWVKFMRGRGGVLAIADISSRMTATQ